MSHSYSPGPQGYSTASPQTAFGWPGAHPGYAPPGQWAPPEGAPAAAKKRNTALFVGLGAGTALLVMAVAAALVLRGGAAAPMPMATGKLPDKTRVVSRYTLRQSIAHAARMHPRDVPRQALWSALAEEPCGGVDVFDLLLDGAVKGDRGRAGFALAHPALMKQALSCGKELAAPDMGVYSVVFRDKDDKPAFVRLMALGAGELPSTVDNARSTTDPAHMKAAHCLMPLGSSAECDASSPLVAKLEGDGLWAQGMKSDVKSFGDAYSPGGSNRPDRASGMEEMASSLASYDSVQVEHGDSCSDELIGFPGDGVSMYIEDTRKELNRVLKERAKVCGRGLKDAWGAAELRFVVRVGDRGDIAVIEKALRSYHARLKEKISARDEKGSRDEAGPETASDYAAATRAMAQRALRDATIEVDDRRIVFVARQEPKDGEREKIERYIEWRADHAGAAAKVIDALANGEAPGEDEIDKLGGAELRGAIARARRLIDLGWNEAPEKVYMVEGLHVPGGGKYQPEPIGKVTFHIFQYKQPKDRLPAAFRAIAEADGWTFKTEDKLDFIVKGDKQVGVIFGGPESGGSTLALVTGKGDE